MSFRFTSGPLQTAVDRSVERRLKRFVQDAESEPVALFSPEARESSPGGDWYGEHVGKWLVAASKAVARTGDEELRSSIVAVVAALTSWQEPDGYLGTYPVSSPSRFTSPDAEGHRTWDLWVHAWMILGLLETGLAPAQIAAERVGRLVACTFRDGRHLAQQGNHSGLSSLVMIEPLARLCQATGDNLFAELARAELVAADLGLHDAKAGCDVTSIGTGKAYQILWCLLGMLELGVALEDGSLIDAAKCLYEDVRLHHLSPLGGPWGGIATHKEVFNPRGFFSPTGFVETCSSTTWLDLSARLYRVTGDPAYAAEAERVLLNAILGAQDANGEDWCYFTFANGRRNNTYHWACCKSSGALALELATEAAFDGTTINLLQPFESDGLRLDADGDDFVLASERPAEVHVRVPEWGALKGGSNGYFHVALQPGTPARFTCRPTVRMHEQTHTVDHHGQEVVREEYVCFSRGPFVLAAATDGDIHAAQTLRLPRLFPMNCVQDDGAGAEIRPVGGKAVKLEPYFMAGGRHDGAWRNTWFPVAWQ